MKNLQSSFSIFALVAVLFTAVSCSSDDEALSVEAGVTGKWEVASEHFLVDGEDPQLPREVTRVPATGSIVQFNADKSMIITSDTISSNSTWRAGEERNLFVTLASENVETEFAVRSLTYQRVDLLHTQDFDIFGDGNLREVEISILLVRKE